MGSEIAVIGFEWRVVSGEWGVIGSRDSEPGRVGPDVRCTDSNRVHACRQAIYSISLVAWRKGGRWMVLPDSSTPLSIGAIYIPLKEGVWYYGSPAVTIPTGESLPVLPKEPMRFPRRTVRLRASSGQDGTEV